MTIGSLFSGVGGLELGLELCGLGPVVWQCERDPYARGVLAHHWPDARVYRDVRRIDDGAARVEVICGGFPCQPHSVAGKRRGTADSRWLWPLFAATVERFGPRFVFVENVPALRTSGLRNVLADLAALGFDAEWDCFSASEVGAPHRRQRLFIVAHAAGAGLEGRGQGLSGPGGADRHVADTDGGGVRDQQQRLSGGRARGVRDEGAPVLGNDGARDLANSDGEHRGTGRAAGGSDGAPEGGGRRGEPERRGEGPVADTDGGRLEGERFAEPARFERAPGNIIDRCDMPGEFPPGPDGIVGWAGPEPAVRRKADGLSGRLDRLRCLGNAVVPQVAALAWRTLLARAGWDGGAHGAPVYRSERNVNDVQTGR